MGQQQTGVPQSGDEIGVASYARHGRWTDPGSEAARVADLPGDVAGLCGVVQGMLVHVDWLGCYTLPSDFTILRETRSVEQRLAASTRAPGGTAQRSSGTCRDYALMMSGLLRHRGVPARVRCGFATYFSRPFEDHWVCEYWNDADRRWALADAQLDEVLRPRLKIGFSITDLPRGSFLNAGEAWLACREGRTPPESFGHGDDTGLWFVRVNVVRDLLSLLGREVSAWDGWRASADASRLVDADSAAICDRIARVTSTVRGRPAGLDDAVEALERPPWSGVT